MPAGTGGRSFWRRQACHAASAGGVHDVKNVGIVTSHSYGDEALGCGALMRSRDEALARVSGKLRVRFITPSQKPCPRPDGHTLHVEGSFTEDYVAIVQAFLEREAIHTCFFSCLDLSRLAERLPCRRVVETHDVLHLRQRRFAEYGFEAVGTCRPGMVGTQKLPCNSTDCPMHRPSATIQGSLLWPGV